MKTLNAEQNANLMAKKKTFVFKFKAVLLYMQISSLLPSGDLTDTVVSTYR